MNGSKSISLFGLLVLVITWRNMLLLSADLRASSTSDMNGSKSISLFGLLVLVVTWRNMLLLSADLRDDCLGDTEPWVDSQSYTEACRSDEEGNNNGGLEEIDINNVGLVPDDGSDVSDEDEADQANLLCDYMCRSKENKAVGRCSWERNRCQCCGDAENGCSGDNPNYVPNETYTGSCRADSLDDDMECDLDSQSAYNAFVGACVEGVCLYCI